MVMRLLLHSGEKSRAGWALVVVALLEVGLFALQSWEEWYHGLRRVGTPQTLAGEGLVIRGDGLGYYAWLRSLMIDGDWSFDNEFDEHNPLHCGAPNEHARTALGRRTNRWSIGPACVWAVTVVPGHVVIRGLQRFGFPWAADGYTLPYQLLVGLTSLLVSLGGLVLVYRICRRYARPVPAALAAALLTLGSTIVYYSSVEVSMAHGLGTAALAALVWYWLETYGSEKGVRWLLLGGLVGSAVLIRWQLATFAMLPAGEALLECRRSWRTPWRPLLLLTLAGLAAAVAFAPQMVGWHYVHGHWLQPPLRLAHNWLSPRLWDVLGSENRGLFYWTPITLLACVGFLWYFRPRPAPLPAGSAAGAPLALLAASFLVQVHALASIRGVGVYLGSSYGFRQLTEALVVAAPGLALLLDRAGPRLYRCLCVVGCVLVLWNLALICQYRYLLIPANAGASPARLLGNLPHLIHGKPLILAAQLLVTIMLWVLLRRREAASETIRLRVYAPNHLAGEQARRLNGGDSLRAA
jgi:hypothetical protein